MCMFSEKLKATRKKARRKNRKRGKNAPGRGGAYIQQRAIDRKGVCNHFVTFSGWADREGEVRGQHSSRSVTFRGRSRAGTKKRVICSKKYSKNVIRGENKAHFNYAGEEDL